MAQSSVEWFALWAYNNTDCKPEDVKKAFQKAKEMHKQEIIKAWYERALLTKENHYQINSNTAHQYYNETFGKSEQ